MKLFTTLILLLCSTIILPGQHCETDSYHNALMKNDLAYNKAMAKNESNYQQHTPETAFRNGNPDQPIEVPIVFHIIHTGTPVGQNANISDEKIYAAMDSLNNTFAGMGGGAETGIQFCLATVAPDGSPTTGINRVDGSVLDGYVQYGIHYYGSGGVNEHDVKDLSNWPAADYYNVWVVNNIRGAGAYAQYPNGGQYDGTVIVYYGIPSSILAHELGHGLNLYHTFNGDASGRLCPVNDNCLLHGDRICDTPPHKRGDCLFTECDEDGDFYNSAKNVMSYCIGKWIFTEDQKNRMRDAFVHTARKDLLDSPGCRTPNANDVLLKEISGPTSVVCQDTIFPEINIRNIGDSLHSIVVNYNIDNQYFYSQTFDLELAFGEYQILQLDPVSTTIDTHTLTVSLALPNGFPDEDISNNTLSNDFVVEQPQLFKVLPYWQDFTGYHNDFPAGWYNAFSANGAAQNPGGLWSLHSGQSDEEHYLEVYGVNENPGDFSTQYLYLPPFDLRNANNTQLYFNLAWRLTEELCMPDGNLCQTTLFMDVSAACAAPFVNVWQLSNEALATVPFGEEAHVENFRTSFVDLRDFDGEFIFIRFGFYTEAQETGSLLLDDLSLLATGKGIPEHCPLQLSEDMFFNADGSLAFAENAVSNLADEQETMGFPNYNIGMEMQTSWTTSTEMDTVVYLDLSDFYHINEIHLYHKSGSGNFKIAPGLPEDHLSPVIDFTTGTTPGQWLDFQNLNLQTRYLTFYKNNPELALAELFLCTVADLQFTCNDGILNGNETDVDCGGDCPPCEYLECQIALSPRMVFHEDGSSAASGQFGGSLVDEQASIGNPTIQQGHEATTSWMYPWQDGASTYIDLGAYYCISSIHLFDGFGSGTFHVCTGLPYEFRSPFIQMETNAWPPQWRDYEDLNVTARYLTFSRIDATAMINEIAICATLHEPTCNDGIQNGNETGIDCGGSCNPCPKEYCKIPLHPQMFYDSNNEIAAANTFGGSLADEQNIMGNPVIGMGEIVFDAWQFPWADGVQTYVDLEEVYNISSIHLFDGFGEGIFTVAEGLPEENNPPFIEFNANAWPPQWVDFGKLDINARYLTFTRVDADAKINEIAICGNLISSPAIMDNEDPGLSFVQNEADNQLDIYPNPATDIVNVVLNKTHYAVKAKVINTSNNIVIQQNIYNTGTPIKLATDHLPKGIYFVYLETENGHPVSAGRFLKME